MSQSRQALAVSIVYSFALIVWLTAHLEIIEWNETNLQFLFIQVLCGLILLQCFSISFVLSNHTAHKWQDDALAIGHILFFPLPLYSLIWLSGSASPIVILKSLILVCGFAACSFFIQYSCRLFMTKMKCILVIGSAGHVFLSVMLWNFRQYCWDWLLL